MWVFLIDLLPIRGHKVLSWNTLIQSRYFGRRSLPGPDRGPLYGVHVGRVWISWRTDRSGRSLWVWWPAAICGSRYVADLVRGCVTFRFRLSVDYSTGWQCSLFIFVVNRRKRGVRRQNRLWRLSRVREFGRCGRLRWRPAQLGAMYHRSRWVFMS